MISSPFTTSPVYIDQTLRISGVLQHLQPLLPMGATLGDAVHLVRGVERKFGKGVLLESAIQTYVGRHLAQQRAARRHNGFAEMPVPSHSRIEQPPVREKPGTTIWVVECQERWRSFATSTLQAAKRYTVEAKETYELDGEQPLLPDLVVLGCARIGSKEAFFIRRLLAHHCQILVCPMSSAKTGGRSLLRRVGTIVAKPYTSSKLLKSVQDCLEKAGQAKKRGEIWIS